MMQKMERIFEQETNGFFDPINARTLIGASGSFETLYEMLFQKGYSVTNETIELPLKEIKSILDWSMYASLEDRIAHPWIVPMRKKMLPIAACSILWVMKKLNTERLLVSPYSLKEGAFLL